jgi:hypothetical protein
MSAILQPVLDLETQLTAARQKAIDTLLKQRSGIDEQLKQLGFKARGRPKKEDKK